MGGFLGSLISGIAVRLGGIGLSVYVGLTMGEHITSLYGGVVTTITTALR